MKTSSKVIVPVLALAAATMLGSCRHKDLCFDHSHRIGVYVVFDWRNAADANPESMLTYFFPTTGEQPLIYTFADRNGGSVSVPFGTYSGISLNGDNSYWAGLRNTDDPATFEVFTKDAERLEGYGLASRALPRAKGAENERMAKTPGMIWSDRQDGIELPADMEGEKVITFYPDEAVCHYTVDVLGVKNMEYLHGESVDATLSGMAEGYLHGLHSTTDVPVTMPFTLAPEQAEKELHGEFLTFGECASASVPHQLTVYVYLTDGTKWFHTFDVTRQVTTAPDPTHVHIVVDGLELPKPISGEGGFIPDVSEWNDIEINLPM